MKSIIRSRIESRASDNDKAFRAADRAGDSLAFARLGIPEATTKGGAVKHGVADVATLLAFYRAECKADASDGDASDAPDGDNAHADS